MTQAEKITEELIFLCLLKGVSEQSTMLINEYKHEKKRNFNSLIGQIDMVIRNWEATQTEEAKEFIQAVTDVYHNITIDIRRGAKEKYEQQLKDNKAA